MTLLKAYGESSSLGSVGGVAALYKAYEVPPLASFKALANWSLISGSLLDTIGGLEIVSTRGSGASFTGPNRQITWAGNYFTDSVNLAGGDSNNLGIAVSGQQVTIDTSTGAHRPREDSTAVMGHKTVVVDWYIERGNTQWIEIRHSISGFEIKVNFDILNGVVGTVTASGGSSSANADPEIIPLGIGPNGGLYWICRIRVTPNATTVTSSGGSHFCYFKQGDNATVSFTGNGTDFFYVHQRQWVPGYNMPPFVHSTAGANLDAPRTAHDPATGSRIGLLAEPTRVNYIRQCIDLGDAVWTKANTTITRNDALGPDGTMSADKMQHTTTSADIRITTGLTTSGNTCFSALIKKGGNHQWFRMIASDGTNSAAAWFDVIAGVKGSSVLTGGTTLVEYQIENYGEYWRCWVTSSGNGAAAMLGLLINAAGNGNISEATATFTHLTGVQLEPGRKPSSLIITDTATITRNGDNLEFPDSVFDRANGTMMISFQSIEIDDINMFVEGGVSNVQGYSMIQDNGSNPRALWRHGTGNRGDTTATDLDFVEGTDQKMATSWDVALTNAGQLMALDGVAAAAYTTVAVGQADFDGTMNLGMRYDGTRHIAMIFKELVFFGEALGNSDLERISAP